MILMFILRIIISSLTWFISTLPFLVPYYFLLTSQGKKMGYKLSIEHMGIVCIFMYYLAGVLSLTGIPSIKDLLQNSFGIITAGGFSFPPTEINLIPFFWLSEGVRPYIENMLLFVPLGFLLPCIWKNYEVLWQTALSGLAFSLIIELSQLFNSRITDIDDLLMNTLGAVLGWLIFRLMHEHLAKLQDKVAVQSTQLETTPLLLRGEAWFYLACAYAGMFLVFYPFLRPFLHPFLKYFIF
ncbi:VanZ family protein [Desulfitobacterium dichloroeliminans]|nr:VanZ family protein [Desulfitobacterium dichloroeliminans]